jgi:hypothetical protein
MVLLTLSERGTLELRLLEIARTLDEMKRRRVWDLRLEYALSRERELLTGRLARSESDGALR